MARTLNRVLETEGWIDHFFRGKFNGYSHGRVADYKPGMEGPVCYQITAMFSKKDGERRNYKNNEVYFRAQIYDDYLKNKIREVVAPASRHLEDLEVKTK